MSDQLHLAIVPIPDQVLFPGVVIRIDITKPSSISLIEEKIFNSQTTLPKSAPVAVAVATVLPDKKDPESEEVHPIACAAKILRAERFNQGSVKKFSILFEGVSRVKILKVTQKKPYLMAKVERIPEPVWVRGDKEMEDLVLSLKATAKEYASFLRGLNLPSPLLDHLSRYVENSTPAQLADFLTTTAEPSIHEKLLILDSLDLKSRITNTIDLLKKHIQVLKISSKIHSSLEGNIRKKEREALLRKQLRAIKEELGGKDGEDELELLEKKLSEAGLPAEVEKTVQRDFKKLGSTPSSQPEYTVLRNYLEWISELPWSKTTTDNLSIEKARQQLNHDHFGLEKVKKRVLEFLAVKNLKNDIRGPILCFVGPPGVGKTSLGQSIAQSLGRKFYRMSLGGVRDEAEIRGHRRTYIGALPGRVIQALRRAGTNNPVILLDEIDKLARDIRGDPSSALLEVLDPEQNSTFTDHYLAVPFDLSKVLFIATANTLETIPGPLLDRMEVIEVSGYTPEEKIEIAKSHLLPRQVKEHGIADKGFEIPDEVLAKVVSEYTREAGVRSLERQIGAICRYAAMQIADNHPVKTVTPEMLVEILGPEKFENDLSDRLSIPGVVAGLAYTQTGGALLFVEATKMEGTGKLTLTGQLGDVMKESAQAAMSWVRANAGSLGLLDATHESPFAKTDVHIHFPAGAVPKDGPSAGVTIVTALVSLFADRPLLPLTAMTGEIALRGLVLPVGGIKEKVLAAHRNGIRRVIMPARNARDLRDLPKNVISELDFIFVKNIPQLLNAAFSETENGFMDVPFSHL